MAGMEENEQVGELLAAVSGRPRSVVMRIKLKVIAHSMSKSFLSSQSRVRRLIFAWTCRRFSKLKIGLRGLGIRFILQAGSSDFHVGDYFQLVDSLRKGKRVFVDLKFFDVPETVTAAVMQLKDRDIDFVTVHGNENMIKAAVEKRTGSRYWL
jgi:hypothetical protein